MITELFAVFDLAAKRFMDPFPGPTVEFALRGFKEACETEGHQFQNQPSWHEKEICAQRDVIHQRRI